MPRAILVAENRPKRLFTKNTSICEVARRSIGADTCPVLEGQGEGLAKAKARTQAPVNGVATVAGVPAAQALGQVFGWRSAFVFVAVVGLVALVSLWVAVPHMTRMPATRPLDELGALATPQVWFTVAMGTVGFGGMFAVYTYITWTMTEVAGFPETLMWLVLMAYGLGMVVGTYLGGFVSDRFGDPSLPWIFAAMAVALTAFFFTAQWGWVAVLNFGIIGMLGSVLVPNLQTRLMDVAGRAQTLAAALNQAALNARWRA